MLSALGESEHLDMSFINHKHSLTH